MRAVLYVKKSQSTLVITGQLWLSRSSGMSPSQKVGGSIPSSSGLHVEVSLDKILNPKLLPMAAPLVWECVCVGEC